MGTASLCPFFEEPLIKFTRSGRATSPRSGRQHKARGVSPGISETKQAEPTEVGDSRSTKQIVPHINRVGVSSNESCSGVWAVARFASLFVFPGLVPGAYAPGLYDVTCSAGWLSDFDWLTLCGSKFGELSAPP